MKFMAIFSVTSLNGSIAEDGAEDGLHHILTTYEY